MTPLHIRNALDIHGWLRSYEARTAVKDANGLPRTFCSESYSPAWRLITKDRVCEWVRDDGIRAKPIQPFRVPKTEQQIAELYCRPRAYYHCVEFLSEAPKGFFTFDELNEPSKWLNAISRYLAVTGQGELSLAAKQLHRLVEEARKEFREAQDRAWRNRKLPDRSPEDYYRKEATAWEKFSKEKQALLQRYNRAIKSGVVERVKRKKARICPICGKEPLRPGQRKCDECRRETRRQRNRRYYAWSRDRSKTGSLLGITPAKPALPLLPPPPQPTRRFNDVSGPTAFSTSDGRVAPDKQHRRQARVVRVKPHSEEAETRSRREPPGREDRHGTRNFNVTVSTDQ